MARSTRLLDLIQSLRRHRRPVTAAALSDELGVSERTIYRDIGTLVSMGAPIDGEAGIGYVLRPGFLLPPMMFGDDEIEALVLGLRWVAERGDASLSTPAANALAKIADVLPPELRDKAGEVSLLVGPRGPDLDLSQLRRAIRDEHKLKIGYADEKGQRTDRMVWPFALGFFENVRVLCAWCELRQDYRHFRTDRIVAAEPSAERYPRRRRVLLAEWRKREGIGAPDIS